MYTPHISVIVPVYNTYKFLERCFTSISQQSFKNIEIIAINDGSTDESLNKLKQLQAQDSRIKIHSQANAGLSAARNSGIKLAQANLVSFIDSDDTIECNMLETMYNHIVKKQNVDIVFTRCNYVNAHGNITKISHPLPLNKEVFFSKIISNELSPGAPLGLYNKKLFIDNKIFYPVQKFFEDVRTTYKLIYFAKDISVVQTPLYNYYNNKNSISNTLSQKHIIDLFDSIKDLKLFLKNHNILEKYNDELIVKLENIIKYLLYKTEQNKFSSNKNNRILQTIWSLINTNNCLEYTHISKKLLFYYMTINIFDNITDKEKFLSKYFILTNKQLIFLQHTINSNAGLFVYALQELKKRNIQNIYLYGAGTICQKLIPIIEQMNIKILAIIDKNATEGSMLENYNIIKITEFKTKSYNTTVLVASESFTLEITLALEELKNNINVINFYNTI